MPIIPRHAVFDAEDIYFALATRALIPCKFETFHTIDLILIICKMYLENLLITG